ncbi:MFS transporter [Desulfatitalea alkaliphila]|uniref:MFS transporter n=1 Tax=Desulfatitalea alkaliphila TaxID=2929485 RepID=A0AA41R4T5_9BACT|nr:MFS transporter [Desulfatitalea alkaliphila]MCJ8499283.1 MFS transporter [Desulfatitalea alkaliphila]
MPADGDHDAAARERSALFVATLTSFMGPFMISSVNVALPSIQAELGMSAVQLSWIPTAYLLAMAMVLVPAGRVADIHGRKRIFTAGLVVYTIASTLAALVPTTAWLIALRVGQGIGAAMFVTTGMAIVTSVFPPQRRGRAIGIYVAAVYIGLSVGPFAGGLLVQHVGWRSLFALMLPLGAVSVGVTLRFLKGEWAEARGEPLDIVGSLLYAGAIFALVYGGTALPSAAGGLLALGGLVGLLLFARRQARIAHPVFDVSLFRTNRVFAFSSLAALINYAATFAITFMLSLFLQYIKGLPPQTAGLVLVAQPAVMALFSPLAGRWADRIQPRWIASAGMLLTTLGLVGLLFLHPDVAIGRIVVNLALLGLGFALFSSPNMSAIMGSVAKHQYGIASGAVATMRLLGQMISMAVAAVVLAITIGQAAIAPANYPQLLGSLQILLAIFAGMCIFGIYFSMARGEIGK